MIAIVIFLFYSCGVSVAQNNTPRELSWKNNLKIADRFFEEGFYYDAAHYYQKVLKEKPENVDVIFKMAESFFLSRDYKQAREAYESVMIKNEQLYPLSRFKYALSNKMTGDYASAKDEFAKFIKEYRGSDSPFYKKIVKNEIAGCDYAIEAIKKPLSLEVHPMSKEVNAAYTEAAPMPVGKDKLLYASLRSDTLIVSENIKENAGRFKLYQAIKKNDGWENGMPLPENINVPSMDVANGTFSPDGSKFFFTQCESNEAGRLICSIYSSDYKDGIWSNVVRLDKTINVPGFTSTHPAVEKNVVSQKKGDGKGGGLFTLYFVSDMPGGVGGLDIWYTEISSKGEYKPPVNAGNKINTISDELTPFFNNSTRTLSFSSNGHPSMGGYDIFIAEGSKKKWSEPENAGYPLNSSVDDMYYSTDMEGDGYLVSNRKGAIALKSENCCDDIFRVQLEREKIVKIAVTGFAFDEEKTSVFSDNIRLQLVGSSGDALLSAMWNKENLLKFEKLPEMDNYKFMVNDLKTDTGFIHTLTLFTQKGEKIQDAIMSNEGYFIFDKFPKQNNYIFSMDVIPDVGFQLFMVDKDSSEILVNEMLLPKGEPYFFTLKQNKNYRLVATKGGYFSNDIKFSTSGIENSITLYRNLPLRKLELNKAIILKDIYYDFDKATLRPESDKTLAFLVEILNENPRIIVELSAHTDSKGDDRYNEDLSQRRAESVVKYLKKSGIDKDRLVAKGYGEKKPIAPNTTPEGTDNPEGRQLNRRTEIKVIGETKVVVQKKAASIEDALKDKTGE